MVRFSAAILIVSTLSSLPDTPFNAGKTETFPRPFSHGLTVKNSKGARWCSPNSLQRFSDSDFVSLRFSLEIKTPSNAMPLRWSSSKQRVFLSWFLYVLANKKSYAVDFCFFSYLPTHDMRRIGLTKRSKIRFQKGNYFGVVPDLMDISSCKGKIEYVRTSLIT